MLFDDMLESRVNREEPIKLKVPANLIVRDSTGPAPKK